LKHFFKPINKTSVPALIWIYLVSGLMTFSTGVYAHNTDKTDSTGNAYTDSLAKSYPIQNEYFIEELRKQTYDKNLFRHYVSTYKSIFKALNESIKEGHMVHMPGMSALLEQILHEIKTKNPAVPGDVSILLVRDNIPNAYTMGDHTVFVNMGLFYHLESEDQVAAIIAHEIGHIVLKHSIQALNNSYKRDKESIEEVKTIRHADIKRSDFALELLRNSIYRGKEIGREHEMQADSLGYVLLSNTRYNSSSFVKALEIIEAYDSLSNKDTLHAAIYKRLFDLPGQPFKDKWLKGEDFSSYNYSAYKPRFDEDSVSTHPKTEERIKYLADIFPGSVSERAADAPKTDSYDKIRVQAEKELMPNLFFNEEYGSALYKSLLSLQANHDEEYYKTWMSKCLQKLYEARRDYKLNKYLDRVTPKDQTESYMMFLNFMWNLNLTEIKNIADFYPVQE